MFFTHLGRVIAILALAFGIIMITMGVLIASGIEAPYEAALVRFTTAKSSRELFDRGIYTILLGVAFGILTEIRYALRAQAETSY